MSSPAKLLSCVWLTVSVVPSPRSMKLYWELVARLPPAMAPTVSPYCEAAWTTVGPVAVEKAALDMTKRRPASMMKVCGAPDGTLGVPVRTKRLSTSGSMMALKTPLKPASGAPEIVRLSLLTTPCRPAVVTSVTAAAVRETDGAVALAAALSVMLVLGMMAAM